jgi:hypothetical protein
MGLYVARCLAESEGYRLTLKHSVKDSGASLRDTAEAEGYLTTFVLSISTRQACEESDGD